MYASRNAVRRAGSSTSSTASAASCSTLSTASRMKTGLFTPALRSPRMMRPAVQPARPRITGAAFGMPSGTRTWVRPSASATATASDDFPVPQAPARQGTRAWSRGGPGRTTSAGLFVSAPAPRSGPSTVSGPRICGHAASTSSRRFLTCSRPPWVRSSACFRCTGSNRAGSRVRHGSDRTIPARSSTSSTALACGASVRRSARRSDLQTGCGSPAPSRAPTAWSTRAPGVTNARTASSAAAADRPPAAADAASAAAGGSSTAAGPTAPSRSRPSASRSSTTGTRPHAARSGRPHRSRCSAVVTTQAPYAGSCPSPPASGPRPAGPPGRPRVVSARPCSSIVAG